MATQSRRDAWIDSLKVYTRPRLIAVLLMGFSSGLPLPLTFGTLSFRLAEQSVSRTMIGLFALVGLSYTFKFVWSPIIDRLGLGAWTRALGRRRGWALLIQLLLIPAILLLGFNDPKTALWWTALFAVIVAFLSASQDIVIDAYRIELLTPEEQGPGSAATQWGYRFGLIASSAGALYAVEYSSWAIAHVIMAALMGVGMITVWMTAEPAGAPKPADGVVAWFQEAVVGPFAEFMTRPAWLAILLFVVVYKFGDALLGVMANPFYVAMGFTRIEVANISKLLGPVATFAGIALGGTVVAWLGFYRGLLVCGLAQMLSNLMYVFQALVGHDPWWLAVTIAVENVAGGMGSAAFVAYLSSLCNIAFTATQYALLSSLAAVPLRFMSATGGWLADRFDWVVFFLITTAAALPGLIMVMWLIRRFPTAERPPQGQPALALDD